jgi:hypothetical protein
LLSKNMISMLFTVLFTYLTFFGLVEFGLPVYSSCFLPQHLFNHDRVSVALFPRFAQHLVLFLCRNLPEIASGHIHDSI